MFNLIKPFNDILVTTYMDYLKADDEREINHHGTSRPVGEAQEDQTTNERIVQVAPVDDENRIGR